MLSETPEMPVPVLPLDINIKDTPEFREKIRQAAQPGGIDAMAKETGVLRHVLIGEGIVVALYLGMKKEAAGMGLQATPMDRAAIQDNEGLREAAKKLSVSWGSVSTALRGSTGLTARTKYLIGGALVLAILIPTGIYLKRRRSSASSFR